MENKPSSARKVSSLDVSSVRRLVLVLAVSSTLGFWAIFSKLSVNAAEQLDDPSRSAEPLPSESAGVAALDLPPIPTLVPPLNLTSAPTLAGSVQLLPTPSRTLPSKSKSGLLDKGGDTKMGGQHKEPAANTRSSK